MDGAVGEEAGTSIEADDINGDGVDDLIIGAPKANPSARAEAGQVYVYYGTPSGMFSVNSLPTAVTPQTGVKVIGAVAGDRAGTDVAVGNNSRTRIKALSVAAPNSTVGGNGNAGKTFNLQKLDTATYDLNGVP